MKKLIYFSALGLFVGLGSAHAQKPGDKVEVLYQGKWHDATVKEFKDSKWLVHYISAQTPDEWVGKDRIKAAWKVGDVVEVENKGEWTKAKIIEVGEGKYRVHYEGWGKEWDEWVMPSRIK